MQMQWEVGTNRQAETTARGAQGGPPELAALAARCTQIARAGLAQTVGEFRPLVGIRSRTTGTSRAT